MRLVPISMFTLLLVAVQLQPAQAQTDKPAQPPAETGDFTALEAEGRELYNQRNYSGALRLFERAIRIKAMPKIFYNIGQAHRKLGHCSEAIAAYERYRRSEPDLNPEQQAELQHKIESTKAQCEPVPSADERHPSGDNTPAAAARTAGSGEPAAPHEPAASPVGAEPSQKAPRPDGPGRQAAAGPPTAGGGTPSRPGPSWRGSWAGFGITGVTAGLAVLTGSLSLNQASHLHNTVYASSTDYTQEQLGTHRLSIATDVLIGVSATALLVTVIATAAKYVKAHRVESVAPSSVASLALGHTK